MGNNNIDNFRNYDNVEESIKENYYLRKIKLRLRKKMHKKYLTFDRKLSFDEIFNHLEKFVDISDPDITLPNFYGIQTAEGMRKDGHPNGFNSWVYPDIGKINVFKRL